MSGSDLTILRGSPIVDFTSQDFDSLKEDFITFAQQRYSDRWTDFNDTQWAVVFLEMQAYLGDLLTYNMNSMMRELFAASVVRRSNLALIGRMFDFELGKASSSTVVLALGLNPAGTYPFSINPSDHSFSNGDNEDEVVFVPMASTTVAAYDPGGVSITCIEGEYVNLQIIGVGTGAPSQKWQFPQDRVVFDSVSITVGGVSWSRVKNLSTQASTAKVYRLEQDDEGNTFAIFGDGVSGSIPAASAQIRATFRRGGGRRGRVNKNTVQTKVTGSSNIVSVNNPAAAQNGEDEQPLAKAKLGIPAYLSTLERAVTDLDYARLVKSGVAGVAKVKAGPDSSIISRTTRLWVAPEGGGDPSVVLKTKIANYLFTKKITNQRPRISGPVYRSLRLQVLLHVNSDYRAIDTESAVRSAVTNLAGTGLMDFNQLDFAAVTTDEEGAEVLLLSQTRLHQFFSNLSSAGLDRAEIERLDVIPEARPKPEGNTGDGSITGITLNGKQRRRQFYIRLSSSATYEVYERIVGRVSDITDTTLTDSDKQWDQEGVTSFSGYVLSPSATGTYTLNVGSASGTDLTISGTSVSLFAYTAPKSEYFVYHPTPTVVLVGSEFVSADGSVRFTVTAGVTGFIAGDSFTLDVHPTVSDLRLATDEYPELDSVNFTTRTSGGARV
jgi:hypothetical protein